MQIELQNATDEICKFLARRDIASLSMQEVLRVFGVSFFDVVLVFGCDVLETAQSAARVYHAGLCKKLLFSGGIGHGTAGLRKKAALQYGMDTENWPEGDIMAAIAIEYLHVPAEAVLIENRSTNSGENAAFSLQLLEERGVQHNTILLIQDPFMQLRSHLTLKANLKKGQRAFSYAPLIPTSEDLIHQRHWTKERFVELLTRELPRLRDDENGYGPKGAGFIEHVDIPAVVEQSYALILQQEEQLLL